MAWRFSDSLICGEIDNRTPGRVVLRLCCAGAPKLITVEMEGDAAQDLAGRRFLFYNRGPIKVGRNFPDSSRKAKVGEISASRQVKVPDVELHLLRGDDPSTWHWEKALSIEWFTSEQGRMQLELAGFLFQIEAPKWTMDEAGEEARAKQAARNFGEAFNILLEADEISIVEEDPSVRPAQERRVADMRRRLGWPDDQSPASMTQGELDEEEEQLRGLALIEGQEDEFHDRGLRIPRMRPEEEIAEAEIDFECWRLIYFLAGNSIFCDWTEHLSSRELYRYLMTEILPDSDYRGFGWNRHIEVCSVEGEEFLRFYGDDDDRRMAAESGQTLPPKEPLPHPRRAQMPQPFYG